MFDLVHDATPTAERSRVLFFSNPLGRAREWNGMSDVIGGRAACHSFDGPSDISDAMLRSGAGAHIVAHGTAAYHALQTAIHSPEAVAGVTLIDPDFIAALPDLHDCPTYRQTLSVQARAAAMVDHGQNANAAAQVVNWWMGRKAWANTSARLQTRFAASMPALVAGWRAQADAPLCLLGLASIQCPIQIVTGRNVPADIRALTRVMRLALRDVSLIRVPGARGAAHLTHPHVVGPAVRNFIVCNDRDWHTDAERLAA